MTTTTATQTALEHQMRSLLPHVQRTRRRRIANTIHMPRSCPRSCNPDRWSEAVSDSRDYISTVRDGLERLNELRSEYETWHGNLPENLQNGTLGEKLQAVIDIDIDSHLSALDELEGVLDECESADLPRGFGND